MKSTHWRVKSLHETENIFIFCANVIFCAKCFFPELALQQKKFPPNATGTCEVCGGTLTVTVEDIGTEVAIDQVFLEPGQSVYLRWCCIQFPDAAKR